MKTHLKVFGQRLRLSPETQQAILRNEPGASQAAYDQALAQAESALAAATRNQRPTAKRRFKLRHAAKR